MKHVYPWTKWIFQATHLKISILGRNTSLQKGTNSLCITAIRYTTWTPVAQQETPSLAKELDQLLCRMIEDPKGMLLHARGQEHPCLAWHPTWRSELWSSVWTIQWCKFRASAWGLVTKELKEMTEPLPATIIMLLTLRPAKHWHYTNI